MSTREAGLSSGRNLRAKEFGFLSSKGFGKERDMMKYGWGTPPHVIRACTNLSLALQY